MLVSVIIPTRDRAYLLPETLAGLDRQTYRPLEVIVVDDGSTDDTWERLGDWMQTRTGGGGHTYRRVRQAPAGAAAARNRGLAVAQGELIQYLDSDDRMSWNKVSAQVAQLMADPRLDGAYCAWRSWFDGSLIRYGPRHQTTPIAEQAMLLGYLGGTWFLPLHAYLFRRALLKPEQTWNEALPYDEDAEYLLRLLAAGARLGYAPHCCVDYRRHATSQVSRLREHQHREQLLRLDQSIGFRKQICAGLPTALRAEGLAAVAALAQRRQAQATAPQSALVAFGRSVLGTWVRRRFGDGLLAWFKPAQRQPTCPVAPNRPHTSSAGRNPRLIVVIPTKDRWMLLPELLAALDAQTCPPARVIVVDASVDSRASREHIFDPDRVMVLRHQPPSAATQRNLGIRAALGQADLIALIDDDVLLAPDALEQMLNFWKSNRARDVVGAGFNQTDLGALAPPGGIKRSRLAERLGLYQRHPGAVAASGWQSVIGTVERDTPVDWLPTTAAVWASEALSILGGFDEYFTGYSYLEDLEFSWRARRLGRLVVVADARYLHRHATAGKITPREFGRVEVRNRLYFVSKHGLSRARCVAGLLIRSGMTLATAARHRDRSAADRFLGNLRGLADALRPRMSEPPRTSSLELNEPNGDQDRHGPSPSTRAESTCIVPSPPRPRVLVCAYACNPERGSEEAVGWNWVQAIAGFCDATVITADFHRPAIESYLKTSRTPWTTHIRFIYPAPRPWHYRPSPGWRKIEASLLKPLMHFAYLDWLRDAAQLAADLIERERYDLAHQLTYVGFRFPGGLWRLPLPFVWGPIGGLEDTPWHLFGALDTRGQVYYGARNLINGLHRRLLVAPRRAARRAGPGLIAATSGIALALRRCYGTDSVVVSEVTAPTIRTGPLTRRTPGAPLRLAWSGEHAPGKALPLLLHALARVTGTVAWQLSVFGSGPCTRPWRRLAVRLGLDGTCQWTGHLPRGAMIGALDEAHLFVITSLKDLTSTVLVEALSRGVPIVCPDHCGFTDAITPESGVRLPIDSPAGFVAALADAIVALDRDEPRRLRLAAGARRRARDFSIDAKADALAAVYRRRLAGTAALDGSRCEIPAP